MHLKPVSTFLIAIVAGLQTSAYSIWPVPQSISHNSKELAITNQITIVADESVSQQIINRAKEVLEQEGVSYTVSDTPSTGSTNLLIGEYTSQGHATRYADEHGLSLKVFDTPQPCYDPHIVYVDSSTILVIGDEEGSAFYGMATLEQLLEQRQDDTLQGVEINDYAHTKYRGVVEGFYGHPWSMDSRLNLLDYMKRYKMNYYVYGPKADPYHAGNWRINYPESVTEQQKHLGQISTSDMQTLASHASQSHVDFVWAIHPTLGSYYVDLNWTDEIMSKFEQLYSLGVRHFGVSVDDMNGHPSNQSQLPHLVQQAIDTKWNQDDTPAADRVGNLLFVPTCYALNYGATYSLTPIRDISPKVEVAFTGYDCFSNVRASSFSQMAGLIGRDPIFWWNNPVNDDYDNWLYMHGLTKRWTIEQQGPVNNMRGFLLNPMNQGQVSKICLFSAADYSWNPTAFNEQASWEQSLKSIVKTDENAAALKNFIRVMSAYTTKDTRTPEGEELKDLYLAFQNSYQKDEAPECAELLEAMQNCYDACQLIRTFKDSSDSDLALFYTDIQPWLDKLSDMCYIVIHSVEYMNGKASLDNWTGFADLVDMAQSIHSRHTMSVLEGSGASTSESFQEVQPAPTYFDPFIDFLAGVIPNHAPALPARDKSPKIITNLTSISNVELQSGEESHALTGLSDISLNLGEYVGICLNSIEKVTLTPPALPSGIVLEHSISGKEWTAWDGEETDMAYFRLRGDIDCTTPLSFNSLPYSIELSEIDSTPTAYTNMGTWQDYVVSNVVDGQEHTFFWSNNSQQTGDYITLDFGAINPRRSISLRFNSGDQPTGTVLIQLSDNGTQWNTISSFTSSDIKNDTYTCQANDIPARYVRMYLQSASGGNWLQVAEFSVNSIASSLRPVTVDSDGNAIATLNDISLTTYHAADGAGFIEHQFIENIDIQEIHIYHNSHFTDNTELPVVELFSNGEWHQAGVVKNERTIVSVPDDLRHVTRIRISWTEGNAPQIYEIYPVGPDYIQPASDFTGIESVEHDTNSDIKVFQSANSITITAPAKIDTVDIVDTTGRIIATVHPNSQNVTIPVNTAIVIANIRLVNGVNTSKKLTLKK